MPVCRSPCCVYPPDSTDAWPVYDPCPANAGNWRWTDRRQRQDRRPVPTDWPQDALFVQQLAVDGIKAVCHLFKLRSEGEVIDRCASTITSASNRCGRTMSKSSFCTHSPFIPQWLHPKQPLMLWAAQSKKNTSCPLLPRLS